VEQLIITESTVFRRGTSQPADIQIPSLGRVPKFKEMTSNRARSPYGLPPDRVPSNAWPAYRQIVYLPTPDRLTGRRDFTSPSLSKVLRFETMLHLPVFNRTVDSRKSDTRNTVWSSPLMQQRHWSSVDRLYSIPSTIRAIKVKDDRMGGACGT